MRTAIVVCVLVILGGLAGTARAYPQFQLSRDTTCTACHLSPAGGGLLSENGYTTAESISQFGTDPGLFYSAVPLPSWLEIGGDLRGASGGFVTTQRNDAGVEQPRPQLVTFPMQADLYVAATYRSLSLHVTAGARDPQYQNVAATLFGSREHWLQWQQHPGETSGLYARVGRFMPVFGLRFIEHPDYDRRYGGTPLYGETYAGAVEYVDPRFELHATAFVPDPFIEGIERGKGGAVYAETRIAQDTALGAELKYDVTPDDKKTYLGVTAKHYFDTPGLLVEGEVQLVHQKIDLGGIDNQLVGYLLGSYFVGAFMLDLGIGAWAPDVTVRYLDQEAVDLNVHWFATSHLELLFTNRLQMLELGEGGRSSGYSLFQLHYRL